MDDWLNEVYLLTLLVKDGLRKSNFADFTFDSAPSVGIDCVCFSAVLLAPQPLSKAGETYEFCGSRAIAW